MLPERIEATEALDRVADPLHDVIDKQLAVGERKALLQGDWLGHPVHPVLTDLPIGFWTSAFVLDLLGRRPARLATVFVGLGVLTAAPTAVTGAADFVNLSRSQRRVGVVHAAGNVVATTLYAMSFVARVRHRRLKGVALGMAGAAAATAGGYLGGHLAFGSAKPAADAAQAPRVAA